MKMQWASKKSGFTIVELLIVIVVIGILSAIVVVAYNGIQERARDSQRKSDIASITKALEMYYLDHDRYPLGSCGPSYPDPKVINASWATTADGSWSVLEAALVPEYMSELPKDPLYEDSDTAAIYGGHSYDYVHWSGSGCGTAGQTYLLAYRFEVSPQEEERIGQCQPGGTFANYSSSEYIVVR